MNLTPVPPPYCEKTYLQPQAVPIVPQAVPIASQAVLIAQPMYAGQPSIAFGDYPLQCTCPRCGHQVVTRLEQKIGAFVWILCFVMFFILLWPCYLIPFCVDVCKDTEHYCPACNTLLGVNKKF